MTASIFDVIYLYTLKTYIHTVTKYVSHVISRQNLLCKNLALSFYGNER